MKKSQLAIIAIGVAAVIFLFSLPKVVVKDDNAEISGEEKRTEGAIVEGHGFGLSEQEAAEIEKFRTEIGDGGNPESFGNLISLFLSKNMFDSAAIYSEKRAEQTKGTRDWQAAGDAWYEAMTFATDNERILSLGQKARESYGKMGERTSLEPAIKNKIAMTYIATEDPMRGITILREILQEDPKNEEALFNLGILSMQSGQYDKAIDRFKSVLDVNENNTKALFYLGMSYLESGDRKEAKKVLEQVKEKDSDPAVKATVESYLRDL